jgi:hypothetical protein
MLKAIIISLNNGEAVMRRDLQQARELADLLS